MMVRSANALVLLGAMLFPLAAGAQAPAFDVASVKPSAPNDSSMGGMPRIAPPSGGRFTVANLPLRMLVGLAYEIDEARIMGGPDWQTSKTFDISAKADAAVLRTSKDLPPLLKNLLADRFRLRVHKEMREQPVQVMVVARSDGRLGRDMKPSTADCTVRPCTVTPSPAASLTDGMTMRGEGQPMHILTNLASQSVGQTVFDETGLTGLFDWELRFDPMSMAARGLALPAGVSLPPSSAPTMTAALQEQLGLKIISVRRKVDVLVIDSADLPTPD
jgi:uncharacterized protein (TIGR03435 family)